jgi:hypothetical protein
MALPPALSLSAQVAAQAELEIEKGHETGHVLVTAETPRMDDSGIFTVRVYDSVIQPHFGDTRGDGPGQFPNGVGYGALNFQVDAAGRPIAFQFAPSDRFKSLPIAIGRVEPLAAAPESLILQRHLADK